MALRHPDEQTLYGENITCFEVFDFFLNERIAAIDRVLSFDTDNFCLKIICILNLR